MTLVCLQVMGNDTTVAMAAASGQLELNVYKPVIVHDVLESLGLLADACDSFVDHCLVGIEPVRETIARHLAMSLMLVTALSERLGYDAAARIAKHAHERSLTLRDATIELGSLTAEEFDRIVRPEDMV
jgi:fumarate hydratase class II